MANVGAFTDFGHSLIAIGVDGVNDNDIVAEVNEAERFNEFAISSTAGAMDVDISLDGTNFITAIALEDKKSTTPQTRVVVTVAAGLYRFFGTVKTIRVRQAGGTAAANPVLACGKIGR